MDVKIFIQKSLSGWVEEPAADVFLRTIKKHNLDPEDFDEHAFLHGFSSDPNEPVHFAETYEPADLWVELLNSFGTAMHASEDLRRNAVKAFNIQDETVRITASKRMAEMHLNSRAELARVREDIIFLKTDTSICAFSTEGELVGAFWNYFHQNGYDSSVFVSSKHRGAGLGLDLVELGAIHIGLSNWFKSPEDMTVNTLAGHNTIKACYRRMVETYGVFPDNRIVSEP